MIKPLALFHLKIHIPRLKSRPESYRHDFDVFSLLNIRKRNNRSHGKRKNGNLKRKNKHVLTLSELSIILKHSGRHMALSHLVTLSISSLRNLDIEAN